MNKVLSEREGMKVILKDGKVIKCANNESLDDITNALRFFRALSDTKYIPTGAILSNNKLQYDYVEERYVDGIEFHETFLEECIKLIC